MKPKIVILLKENDNISELHNFISANNLTNDQLEPYFDLLVRYIKSYNLCKKREDINKCSQDIKGYRYKLVLLSNKKITLILTDCLHSINNSDQEQVHNNFWIKYYDDTLLPLSLNKDLISDGAARQKVVKYLKGVLKQKAYQGLYLHGDSKTGKTYIFMLVANHIIKKQTVCFIVWAEFIMDIKKSFKNDSNYYDKIEQLKTCDVLFIDDLGGETISAWERDELLFSILNARVLPLKTTFINSNYSISELSQHYLLRRSIKSEEIKVKRLIERIQTLTFPIQLTIKNLGKNLATDNNKK